MNAKTWSGRWTAAAVAILLVMLETQLLLSVPKGSQTFDAHLYAGALYWAQGDFGVNPEHPPLAKLVAALALWPGGQ